MVFAFRNEQNFRLEIFFSIAIIALMFYYNIGWIKIILASFIFLVIMALEVINTVFEEITDFLVKNHRIGDYSDLTLTATIKDNKIKNAKDLAASAVLLFGIGSLLLLFAILFKI